ncbi:MAG: histidine kinase N-terminal 7TM domain-containing protein, partial [Anaerolineales bacterium]
MFNRPDIYLVWIYLVAAIPFAWLGLYAWRRRPAIAVTSFAQVMLGMSVWTAMYALEIFAQTISAKILFTKIEYFGIVVAPLATLFFALEFTGKRHLLNTNRMMWISAIPFLALILAWTNEFHHWMWSAEKILTFGELRLLDVQFGWFFWTHLGYSYLLLIIASTVLIIEMAQHPGVYRVQISFVILSILFPLVGNFIFLSGSGFIKNLDLTPLFFLPTAIGLSWAIRKYRLLEILPLEHIAILENMKDGVIVLNPQQRILYINATAEHLLNTLEEKAIGQPFEKISPSYAEKLIPYVSQEDVETEITVGEGKQARVYELSVSSVTTPNLRENLIQPDKMLVLHDITERKETEKMLRRRELLMSSIGLAAEQFLRESAWEQNIPAVLEKIGQAADVSRVSVAINYLDDNNVVHSSLCYEWASPTVTPQLDNLYLRHVPLRKSGLGRWEDWLSQGLAIDSIIKNLPQEEQDFYKGKESVSIAVVPIFVDFRWWGFIVFDECRYERIWSASELEAFYLVANIFGAAETRARTEQKLINRQHTLALLHEIVKISLQTGDVKTMAQTIVEQLGELVHAN